MNRLSTQDRARVISCLVEGCSQRATTRMTGIAKKTVARLALEIGEACEVFAKNALRVTPAMEAGLTDHVWSLAELVGLLEKPEMQSAA